LSPGARALMTTPGAAKWYRSDGAVADQRYCFRLHNEAVLEWLPRESIFFNGSRSCMSLDVSLGRGARFFGWDILCFGRAACGETWRKGSMRFRTQVTAEDRPIWAESANLRPEGGFLESAVGLAGCSVSGTFLMAGFAAGRRLLADCRAACEPGSRLALGAQLGITALPEVLVARYLGHSSENAFEWFRDLWGIVRPAVLGTAAHPPRLWAT
jgi:urease accessory protein